MNVLLVGDIVGKPGRTAFTKIVSQLRDSGEADFVIANAENSASGRGPTPEIANAILDAGADVIILGDHAWDSREMVEGIDLIQSIASSEVYIYRMELTLRKGRCFSPWTIWKVSD